MGRVDMFTPYTVEEAATRWGTGAPDDDTLAQLLAVSWAQCVAFAPLPAPDPASRFESVLESDEAVETIPVGHREAHFQQARNIWNASKTSPGASEIGPDGFTIAVHPLDWHVKQLLRPRTAVPKVG